MGWQIAHPNVTDLLDIATRRGEYELTMEEVRVGDFLRPNGTTLAETELWSDAQRMVVAVKRLDGSVLFPARAEMPILPEDRAVLLTRERQPTPSGHHEF